MISGRAQFAAIRSVCSGSAYGDIVQVALGATAAWAGTGGADVPDICRMLSGSIDAEHPAAAEDRHGSGAAENAKGRHSRRVPALR
ncbi:hypothetical protein Pka01_68610 [Planotetraspora kaengkrachanensis]|uniref:Uncharacterized protein n=1 Tax=Planotetraspora kaengkrachanensis TaxID=575193 RepID=A0A8J3PZ08_9ACTN|nr:hypothetical protein Pka01_68610 [Planotetraspora kaengkrachanensis]